MAVGCPSNINVTTQVARAKRRQHQLRRSEKPRSASTCTLNSETTTQISEWQLLQVQKFVLTKSQHQHIEGSNAMHGVHGVCSWGLYGVSGTVDTLLQVQRLHLWLTFELNEEMIGRFCLHQSAVWWMMLKMLSDTSAHSYHIYRLYSNILTTSYHLDNR